MTRLPLPGLHRWATRRNVLLLLALFLAFNTVVLPVAGEMLAAHSGGVPPLDLQFGYSAAGAQAALAAYGPAGRELYLWIELTADVIYPIVYSLFFSLTISYCLQRVLSPRHPALRLAWLGIITALADLAENAAIVILLLLYPQPLPAVAALAGLLTSTKWLLAGLTIAVLLISLAAVLVTRLARTNPRSSPPGAA